MTNEIISYMEMCFREKTSLQRGMNYRIGGNYSVILMSTRSYLKNTLVKFRACHDAKN
jgi:hypothetical protein